MPKPLVERTETVTYRYGRMVEQGHGREWLWLSPPSVNRDRVAAWRREASQNMRITYRLFRQTTVTILEEIDNDG